jgi:hypothetical protein
MRLYLAAMNLEVLSTFFDLFHIKMNILLSYAYRNRGYWRFMIDHRDKIDGLILDSGAWTLNKKKLHKKMMKVPKDLIWYYQDVHQYFDSIFNYDSDFSVGGFENNYTNQLELEKAGLSPVPVVHDYTGPEEIETYIKKGYRQVALGSFKGRTVDAILHATNRLKSAGIEVHLFKSGSYKDLSRLTVDSADASSWAQHAMCGCIIIWNPHKSGENKTQIFRMNDYQKKLNKGPYFDDYREALEPLIYKTTGITYNDLMGLQSNLYRQVLNCFYYAQIQDIINSKIST